MVKSVTYIATWTKGCGPVLKCGENDCSGDGFSLVGNPDESQAITDAKDLAKLLAGRALAWQKSIECPIGAGKCNQKMAPTEDSVDDDARITLNDLIGNEYRVLAKCGFHFKRACKYVHEVEG